MDEGGLARAQASFAEQVDKSGEKNLADSSAPNEVALGGQGQQMGGGNGHALGVPAAGEQAEDAVAGLPLRYGRASGGDHAGHFQAHIGGRARGRRVVASALEEIGAIDGCGMDIDEDPARTAGGVWDFLPAERVASVGGYGYSFHGLYFDVSESEAQA